MAGKEKKYDIGACEVFWKKSGGGSEIPLGNTSGGVVVKVATETMEIEVDQSMDPIDEITTKRSITIDIPLVEFTLENLQLAFQGSELVTGSSGAKKLVVKSVSGKSSMDNVGELRLHPLSAAGSEDVSKDFNFPSAAPVVSDLEIAYTKDGLKTIPLVFKAYPDAEGVSLVIGDKTAVAGA